jgi:DNA polymerase-3 subunit gamma/tau
VLVPTEEGDFWHATVQALVAAEAITALVRELALQSQLVARDTGHWMLRVERESLNQPAAASGCAAALQAAGHEVCAGGGGGPRQRQPRPAQCQQPPPSAKQAAEEIILDDPFVQTMMRDFGAKIVPGSIKPVHNPNNS